MPVFDLNFGVALVYSMTCVFTLTTKIFTLIWVQPHHAFSAIVVVGAASVSVVASDSEVGGTPVASTTTGALDWLVFVGKMLLK